MDRKLYKGSFTLENFPDYICPKCNKGLLRIEKNSFNSLEPLDSRIGQEDARSEPDWIYYIFNCMFKCTNDRCADIVMCTGSGGVDFDIEVDLYGHQSQEWHSFYRPLFFYPNLKLIDIPESTPDKVKKILNESFEVFFSSPASSANIVRKSIEEILNDLNICMPTLKSNGDKKFISLDTRISKLTENFESLKNRFFAIKWLGNAGSHSGDRITVDDAMDAYELVEDLLLKIYGLKEDKLGILADKIVTFQGPEKR